MNPALHQVSAQAGFSNEDMLENTTKLLQTGKVALRLNPDIHLLKLLKDLLLKRKIKAHTLIEMSNRVGSTNETLKDTYKYFRKSKVS